MSRHLTFEEMGNSSATITNRNMLRDTTGKKKIFFTCLIWTLLGCIISCTHISVYIRAELPYTFYRLMKILAKRLTRANWHKNNFPLVLQSNKACYVLLWTSWKTNHQEAAPLPNPSWYSSQRPELELSVFYKGLSYLKMF